MVQFLRSTTSLSSPSSRSFFLLEKDGRDSSYGNARAKIHLLSIVPRLLGFIRP